MAHTGIMTASLEEQGLLNEEAPTREVKAQSYVFSGRHARYVAGLACIALVFYLGVATGHQSAKAIAAGVDGMVQLSDGNPEGSKCADAKFTWLTAQLGKVKALQPFSMFKEVCSNPSKLTHLKQIMVYKFISWCKSRSLFSNAPKGSYSAMREVWQCSSLPALCEKYKQSYKVNMDMMAVSIGPDAACAFGGRGGGTHCPEKELIKCPDSWVLWVCDEQYLCAPPTTCTKEYVQGLAGAKSCKIKA